MTVLPRLLKVGSMTGSLGVYVPAMILQKGLGLLRVLLFMYLMRDYQAELGLWGLATMIFTIAAPVATLGANHGLTRYVSLYEARGRLRDFYRKVRFDCLAVAAAVTLAGLLASGAITALVIVSGDKSGGFTFQHQLNVCWGAMANMLAAAVYYNLLAFLVGMRAYRLISAIELAFSAIFTVVSLAVLAIWPTAIAVLASHFISQLVVIIAGLALLHMAIGEQKRQSAMESSTVAAFSTLPSDVAGVKGAFGKLLRFGLVAMIGNLLWMAAQNVSFYMINREYGNKDAGVFWPFLQLAQVVLLVGNAAFTVVFAHVARRWELAQRLGAMFTLETAYKAITIALMAITVVLYVAAPLWVKVLPRQYYAGQALLGGLLMYFQAISNFALLSMLARLHERPAVIAVLAVFAGAVNVVLAAWWMPSQGPAGAAWAAGAGMLVGGGAVTAAYFAIGKVKLHWSTYAMLVCPILLVLPPWAAATIWAAVIVVAVFTPWLFDSQQKRVLAFAVGGMWKRLRGAR